MIILRSLQSRPLLLVFLPSYRPPCCFQHSGAYSYTLAYPTVLTIVHYDSTYILSLHNRLPQFDLALSLVRRSPLEIGEHYRQRENIEFC
jgi:hypothetical protein